MNSPGWYSAPTDPPGTQRWWDGVQWTAHLQQVQPVQSTAGADASATSTAGRPIASIFHRIMARIFDTIILLPLINGANVLWLEYIADQERIAPLSRDGLVRVRAVASADTGYAFTIALVSLVIVVVWELLWLMYEGATPGKQLMGLDVVDPTSHLGRVEPVTALKRSAHRAINIIPFGFVAVGVLSAVSLVLMWNDREHRQSVMDRFAGTTVHRLPPGSPRFTPWVRVWFLIFVLMLIALFFAAIRDLSPI